MSWLGLLLACQPAPPLSIDGAPSAAGVVITATLPVAEVEVRDAEGALVVRRSFPTPTVTAELVSRLPPGAYVATARTAGARGTSASTTIEVGERPPVLVEVQAFPGQPWTRVAGDVEVPVPAGGSVEVLLGETTGSGRRAIRAVRVEAVPVPVTVGALAFTLRPRPVARDTAAIVSVAFPAAADGTPDLGRPPSRIALPGRFWERVIRRVGLGGRRRDAWAPWAYAGVTLENRGASPLDVVVSIAFSGTDVAPFRPRLRSQDGDTGTVAVLLRVPADGRATATLPVFVDTGTVVDGVYAAEIRVAPLGGAAPLATLAVPLYVTHGDAVASAGFGLACLATLGGIGWAGPRLRGWLDAAATSELMTIALFGSSLFLVGTASDLLAMALGALLGPFATVVTGLVADVGRYTLLVTLISLLPRPGTLTLGILTGWFLRGFATGSFAPVDILYNGAAIAFCEGFAWLAGLTRGGGAWRDEPLGRRWLRLSVGFAGASVLTTLTGLWLHVILFRLFYADWYVAMQVIGPGLLYTVAACRIGAEFAATLRKVSA